MRHAERRARARGWTLAATSVAAWIGVALMPKCPVCVAVLLSGLGLGAAWGAALSPFARSGLWGIAVVALAGTVYMERRRLSARRDPRRENARACCG
jgi:hypothetical protein